MSRKDDLMTESELMDLLREKIRAAAKIDNDTSIELEHVNIYCAKVGLPKSSCWGILAGYVKPTNAILVALGVQSITMYHHTNI